MKRLWLGVGLLAALLALGIGTTVCLARICDPICGDLRQASEAVQEGKWEQALRLSEKARTRWEHYRSLGAAVTNHEPMEEIDALFDALQIYARQRDVLRFADCCARLNSLTGAISEAQAVYWWTVL